MRPTWVAIKVLDSFVKPVQNLETAGSLKLPEACTGNIEHLFEVEGDLITVSCASLLVQRKVARCRLHLS